MLITSFIFFITNLLFFQNSGSIVVNIQNIKSDKGKIMIALYDSQKTYMKEEKAIDKQVATIKNKQASVTFKNLKYGKYAFVLFHDANNDNKLNTNLVGIPTEDYAFSNNASGMFGPPSFNKSSFSVNSEKVTFTLKIR
jgi:uncharacterized protein (DUF2141 family)